MDNFKPCIVIPVFNHERAIVQVISRLQTNSLPILLVNDGSSEACRLVLENIAATYKHINLLTLEKNLGKGGAVKAGLVEAYQKGYSHAIQVDADGQHAIEEITNFIELGQRNPETIICGCPIYDESVPKLRYYARYLTHIWIWINSLSLTIKDAMCGFRLYPLAPVIKIIETQATGNRMDFDPEIMVRWIWSGGSVINLPTHVYYPDDGISHFLPWRDNALISKMHAKLFFCMLLRSPQLLLQKLHSRRADT